MKRILFLGGLAALEVPIGVARREGYEVITCDPYPENPAHRYSDKFCRADITDCESILRIAREEKVDGILSFAVDPGVEAAAYAANRLGLPSAGPDESVAILQNKSRFRKFLRENGFVAPRGVDIAPGKDLSKIGELQFPVIVKPVDSAGSKGVSKVEREEDLEKAIASARVMGRCGNVIVEEMVTTDLPQSDSDFFLYQGKMVFASFSSVTFDILAPNPFVPAGFVWPSAWSREQCESVRQEVERLCKLLHFDTTLLNVEARIDREGRPVIMECSARGGGNRICEMLQLATGQDLISAAVKAAVGDPIGDIRMPEYILRVEQRVLHANTSGIFDGDIASCVSPGSPLETARQQYETKLLIKPGDEIHPFTGASATIGWQTILTEIK